MNNIFSLMETKSIIKTEKHIVEWRSSGSVLLQAGKNKNRNDDRWGQWFSILGWQRKTNAGIPMGKEVPKVC